MKGRVRPVNVVLDSSLALIAFAFIIYQLFFVHEDVADSLGVITINYWVEPLAAKIISIFLVVFSCMLWLQIIKLHRYLEDGRLKFIGLLSLVFALFPTFFTNIENAISLCLLTFMMYYLLLINKQSTILKESFIASLFLGITTLFFPPAIFLLLFVWITIGIIRPFELRDYVISIIGMLLPAIYLITFSYLLNHDLPSFALDFQLNTFNEGIAFSAILLYSTLILLSLLATLRILSFRTKMIVHQRKQMQAVLVFSLLSLLLTVLNQSAEQSIIFAAFPFMFFSTFFLKRMPYKWIVELLLVLFLLAYIWQSIYGNFPFL